MELVISPSSRYHYNYYLDIDNYQHYYKDNYNGNMIVVLHFHRLQNTQSPKKATKHKHTHTHTHTTCKATRFKQLYHYRSHACGHTAPNEDRSEGNLTH
jgi:hypothetical protein